MKFVLLGLFQTPTWLQFLFWGENEKEIEFLGAVDLEAVTITDKVIVEKADRTTEVSKH